MTFRRHAISEREWVALEYIGARKRLWDKVGPFKLRFEPYWRRSRYGL
jgi:hypothetical protein